MQLIFFFLDLGAEASCPSDSAASVELESAIHFIIATVQMKWVTLFAAVTLVEGASIIFRLACLKKDTVRVDIAWNGSQERF